jgi:hypothetical protein
MRNIYYAISSFLLIVATPAFSLNAPSQRELNGFLLGQYKFVLTNYFGKPYQIQHTDDGWEQRIYSLNPKLNAYMVFEFAPSAPDTIYAMQISGVKGTLMLPFYGVKIGDKREAIIQRFGSPSKSKPLGDIGGELLSYLDRNYSFEIDEYGYLSSIRVMGYAGFTDNLDISENAKRFIETSGKVELDRFITELSNGSIDRVIGFLMPDFEIHTDNRHLVRFSKPARRELLDKTSPVYKKLFGDRDSLKYALSHEKTPHEIVLRLRDDNILYPVVTYPKGRYVREIVFRFHSGRWRIWEVSLRSA